MLYIVVVVFSVALHRHCAFLAISFLVELLFAWLKPDQGPGRKGMGMLSSANFSINLSATLHTILDIFISISVLRHAARGLGCSCVQAMPTQPQPS